jgi:predicted DNA-binding ribbon-helix-helix protein
MYNLRLFWYDRGTKEESAHYMTTSQVSPARIKESFEEDSETSHLQESSSEKRLRQNSSLVSRNVTIAGRRTSVRLEPEMWSALMDVCRRERASMHKICTAVADHKPADTSLTAAIRVFIMAYFRAAATEDGHVKAAHGQGGFLAPLKATITETVKQVTRVPMAGTPSPNTSHGNTTLVSPLPNHRSGTNGRF